MSLFEVLANSQSGLTLSDLSRKLNIPKSTVHYLLYTLTTRGYVQRASDGRHYSLGLRFADVASANLAEVNLRNLVMPYLKQIVARLKLTSTVAVRYCAEAVIIGRVEYAQDCGGGAWVGRHIDLHCTAQGKALIAHLSDDALTRLFAGREMARFTPKTICSVALLKKHCAEVRTRGYAVNDEEMVADVRAVGAPVTDASGSVIASVTVRGSLAQIPDWRIPDLGREMIGMAQEISQRMSNDWV
jgi:DNA-binding IclR family transcriptional regulator